METLRHQLDGEGYATDVVAINIIGGEGTQSMLTARCTFDLLQDVEEVGAWDLMGGRKDDPESLPCEGDDPESGGNAALLDANGDSRVDLSDVVHTLGYLFLGRPPPVGGTECVPIAGCPDACT